MAADELGVHTDGSPCIRPGTGCDTRGCPRWRGESWTERPDDPQPVRPSPTESVTKTADDYAFEAAIERQEQEHSHRLARIWAPVVTLVLLGFFLMLASIVHSVTTEHDHEHTSRVTVWCYADPNSDRGTSTITGTPDQVARFCPDQHG